MSKRELDQNELRVTKLEAVEQRLDLYEFQISSWQFHVGYGAKMIVLYLAVVGLLLKFMLEGGAWPALIAFLGCILCIWTAFVKKHHKKAVSEIGEAVGKTAESLGLDKSGAQNNQYISFLDLSMIFNALVFLVFLFLGVALTLWQR